MLADFVNGTGMITPGNIPVTSGTARDREPHGHYDLHSHRHSYQRNSDHTDDYRDRSSRTDDHEFRGEPCNHDRRGTSSSLTAVFANGTGVITPGNLTATSGAP